MADSSDETEALSHDLDELRLRDESEKIGLELLHRASEFLLELEKFRKYIASSPHARSVSLKHFRTAAEAEYKSLEKCVRNPGSARTPHALRSSNFQYYTSVWNAAKSCRSIIAMRKKFYWLPVALSGDQHRSKGPSHATNKLPCADVDIVAQDGLEWVKVSSMGAKRLLHDLAKRGWVDSDDSEDGLDLDDDEPDGLFKQAHALLRASQATRIRYRHPRIKLVMTRITRGEIKEIDLVITKLEELGIEVQTLDGMPPVPPLDEDLMSKMVFDPFTFLTNTINIDCTMLLALVSDLSHNPNVEEKDWHIRAIRKQIEIEREVRLLPNTLWPACGSRKLVCTREAVQRMYDIVSLIGTESEKQRTKYLMDVEATDLTRQQRIAAFQNLSHHKVPEEWQIPVCTIDTDVRGLEEQIDLEQDVLERVKEHLIPLNQVIFFYGWASGLTTLSSNATVAKKIETTIEECRRSEADRGPDVWVCTTSRSLLAREKERRDC